VVNPGDVLGDFEILREVGRGAMGVVYEARQRSLTRNVAVKVLAPAAAGDPVWVERFRVEATAAARLSHPGILPVYAVGAGDGLPWFAMEFVEGRDLSDVVYEGGALPPREAARIVRDAALALDHAHVEGVLHRDVKPGNLMLRKDGRVVVMDFGLAKNVASGTLTATGSLVGTPYYMSPEATIGEKDTVGPKADVYGLGATLYELVTGKPPFQAENAAALLVMISSKDPLPPSHVRDDVPRDLETIVLAAMEKRPDARYASCKAMADDLDRFLRDEPISRRRPGPIERLRRLVHKNRAAAAIAAASGVLLLGGAVLFRTKISAKEAELDDRIAEALATARAALERGDVLESEKVIERVANVPGARPEQTSQMRDVLAQGFQRRVDAARRAGRSGADAAAGMDGGAMDGSGMDAPASGDGGAGSGSGTGGDTSQVVMEELERAQSLKVPAAWRAELLPPAVVTLRADVADAKIEATNLVLEGDPVRGTLPATDVRWTLGVWRVVVTAPGRVPWRGTFSLLDPGGRFETSLVLPAPEDVPDDMVFLGGESLRAAGRQGPLSLELPPFAIDKTEVTVADYARWLASLPEDDRETWTPTGWVGGRPPPDAERLPVTNVTWDLADRYAAAQGKRLPTVEEMEYAATERVRSGAGRGSRAAFDAGKWRGKPNAQGPEGANGALPVDRTDAYEAPTGVLDLLGNVAEWTLSTSDRDPWQVFAVGGSFRETLGPQVALRPPFEEADTVGFRCAVSIGAPAVYPLPGRARVANTIVVTSDGAASTTDAPDKPLPPDMLFVRQGRRFTLDVPTEGGVAVVFPKGSWIFRPGAPRAEIGLMDGKPTVRLVGGRQERLRPEAFVPDAKPIDAEVEEAVERVETLRKQLAKMLDPDEYATYLAPDFDSDLFRGRANAVTVMRELGVRFNHAETVEEIWGAEWAGPGVVVVRRRIEQRLLFEREVLGGAAVSLGKLPEIRETWLRKHPDDGKWYLTRELGRPLGDRVGRIRLDGAWAAEGLGVVVRAPYGRAAVADEKDLTDVSIKIPLDGEKVSARVAIFRRVTDGIPAQSRADFERFDYEVVAEGTEEISGRDHPAFTTLSVRGTEHQATRRVIIRRGEGLVTVVVHSISAVSTKDALAALVGARDLVKRFFQHVVIEDPKPAKRAR
jgi:formylglycine-generating enzyme required for sulfatase activity/predicted Ser/Thr protein kinase